MAETEPGGTLGRVSLGLGITSAALVFGIGMCALVGVQGGWIGPLGTILFICGASSGFLGVLGVLTGLGGLLSARGFRALAAIGIGASLLGICMFFGFISAIGG